MTDYTIDQYKKRVEQLGQSLLDVVSSVAHGDFDVKVDIPDDIDIFADLAVGLEFMIEDLRELSSTQEKARAELEMKISERTKELEKNLNQTPSSQTQIVADGWKEYTEPGQAAKTLTYDKEKGLDTTPTWLPAMDDAVQNQNLAQESNGNNAQTLSLPLKLQDEVIGVIGFNRKHENPWSNREIATVEAIVEQVSLALENQRLFDQTQSALAEADTLYQASAELNTAQNYTDILKVLQKFSALGQAAQQIHLGLFNTPVTEFKHPDQITVLAGVPIEQNQQLPQNYKIEQMAFLLEEEVMTPDKITTLTDIPSSEHLSPSLRDVFAKVLSANSISFIPLVVGGQWIGYFDLTYPQPVNFTEDDIRRTAAISAQASVAIQNLRSIELAEQRAVEAQQRSEELAIINKVVSAVTAAQDMNESLKIIAEELINAVHVDETSIALLNPTGSMLTQVAFESLLPSLPSMEGGEISLANNPEVTQVINTRKSLLISNIVELNTASPVYKLMDYRKYSKLLIMPLSAGAEVIGTILMGIQSQTDDIDQDEMRMAETILLQASTAIQNARLLDQTQAALTETASLYQANKDLNAVSSAADILSVLQKHTLLGKKSDYCGIYRFSSPFSASSTPDTILPIAQTAKAGTQPLPDEPISFSEWPNLEKFMKVDQMTTIANLDADNRLFGKFREFFYTRLKSKMVVSAPLTVAGRWIGQIYASYPNETRFSESDVTRLTALIGQAAISVNNIELLEETAKRANQLETAAEISQQATSTLDTDALLNRAVNLIRDRFGYYHSSIFLMEGMHATVAASTGEAGKQL
ncbi:MAG TPA: GAF domain-containing protein, partial [Anaerolineales bacterium]|nr:GAF domain-containing protein [Anaerolineales bacterium]